MASRHDCLTRTMKRTAFTPWRLMRSFIVGATFPIFAVTAKEMPLTGPQIRFAISGKYVTDEHHWGHRYFVDGRVERSENGRQRFARWFVKGDRLCLLRPEISKDESICYTVVRDGRELKYKDDGQAVVFQGVVRPMPKRKP